MKRFYLYDPKNRAYGLSYKSLREAIATIKAVRSRYTKEKAAIFRKLGKKMYALDYQRAYEYWNRVVVRETEVTATKDHEVK